MGPGDARVLLFDEKQCQALFNLIDKGSSDVVIEYEERLSLAGKLNSLPGRFSLAVKHKDSGPTVFQRRFVIGGHRDCQKWQHCPQ